VAAKGDDDLEVVEARVRRRIPLVLDGEILTRHLEVELVGEQELVLESSLLVGNTTLAVCGGARVLAVASRDEHTAREDVDPDDGFA